MTKENIIFIMPAYNEAVNIKNTVQKWIPIVKSISGSKLLIINDGSRDKTSKILNNLEKTWKVLKVINKNNEGHGKTIRMGYEYATKSKFTWVFQTDSDGHFSPNDFYKLWSKRSDSPFIVGYRHNREDTFLRKLLSSIIKLWILILFGVYIKDPNIPFRLIKNSYLKKLLRKIDKNVFAPNIFLSVLATKDNNDLQNIPVEHVNRNKKNSIKIFKGAFRGFLELLKFAQTL